MTKQGSQTCGRHHAFVPVIVGLTKPPSMADDRVVQTNRTSPREEVQWDHPESMLSIASGSAIKRITAGVKARRDRSLLKSRSAAGPSPSGKVSFEPKENTALRWEMRAVTQNIGRYIATIRTVAKANATALQAGDRHRSHRRSAIAGPSLECVAFSPVRHFSRRARSRPAYSGERCSVRVGRARLGILSE
jgi:hypothetical protein